MVHYFLAKIDRESTTLCIDLYFNTTKSSSGYSEDGFEDIWGNKSGTAYSIRDSSYQV